MRVSKETGLLQEWPKDGPPLAWKIKGLGGGYSEPSDRRGRIFGMSSAATKKSSGPCPKRTARNFGRRRLETASRRMPQGQEGPGCTPTVDGDRLYVIGMAGEIACLSASDGKIVWHHSLTQRFRRKAPRPGATANRRLIDGEKVICTPGAADAMMVALDKLTGKTIWKTQMPRASRQSAARVRAGGRGGRRASAGAAYSSAIAIDFDGQRQYVQFNSKAPDRRRCLGRQTPVAV